MCGRFVLFSTAETLLNVPGYPAIRAPHGTPGPRYNIAPTHMIPILRPGDQELLLEPARWGLIPHWKKDLTGPPLFNARAETLQQKPSFRDAFRSQRCMIPMDGYYEWTTGPSGKAPQWITTGEVVWVAGLWSDGLGALSATMVTTDALPPLDTVHHRMPRFLAPEEYRTWLEGSPQEAAALLHPAGSELVEAFRISPADPRVGSVANDGPELIEPATLL